jgi:DUF4097 and DUF4098 domain-containing protein YvlB
MKRILIPVLTGIGLCLVQIAAHAQVYKTHISKQFNMQKGKVSICNLNGFVKVEGYTGDKVMIEIDETITADDQSALEEGKKNFKLAFDQGPDSLVAYTAEPYDTRPRRWQHNRDNEGVNYSIKLDYTVKVPNQVDLYAATVNDGDITIKNIYGVLKISNVNGGITIVNAKGTTSAHTVNGPVTVNYLRNPPEASSYYSVNGELNVTYPPGLSADVQLKSLNGQFYTDFTDVEILPSKVSKTESKNGSGTTYKLSKTSDVRFGTGGKTFKFETLNGNVFIKKQK